MKLLDTRIVDKEIFEKAKKECGFIDGKYLDEYWLQFLENQHKLGNIVSVEMIDYYYNEKQLYS